jgi:hypothetical protein
MKRQIEENGVKQDSEREGVSWTMYLDHLTKNELKKKL